jgi:pyruvate formate lyase activating enzyme
MKEALYYQRAGDKLRCLLCPKECLIAVGEKGFCHARKNIDGKLVALTYEECVSLALDPIEKKPLYHFHPGSRILSCAPKGCNLACRYCQNWSISQEDPPTRHITSGEMIALALDRKSIGIAYTYSEPFIWYEYLLGTAKLAKEKGLVNVLVTNGYINPEPLEKLLPFIDAMNIDIKSLHDAFYREYCAATVAPVLKTARRAKEACHVEITNLIIPTLNDKEEDLRRLIGWVKEKLGDNTPVHFSRYFPQYRLNLPPTPVTTLRRAKELAEEVLKYVYLGNIPDSSANTTYCPKCKEALIVRDGYSISEMHLEAKRCTYCGEEIDIVR